MIRILLSALAFALALIAPSAAEADCLGPVFILRDVTIEDASGRWDHQDVLIEQGQITAIGGYLETVQTVDDVLDLSGHILRPAPNNNVLVIRASTATSDPEGDLILAGQAADFLLTDESGVLLAELRDGQPTGQCFTG